MARTRTRLQLRDAARREADMVSSTFVTDTMANDWIDTEVAALWDLLVEAAPERYALTTTISTTTGTRAYNVPADFYKPLAVDRQWGADWIACEPWQIAERNDYGNGHATIPAYRIIGGGLTGSTAQVYFEPDPGTATYRLLYVQAPQLLTADGSTLDGVAGWDDYVVLGVAIRMKEKEESDYSGLMARRAQLEARIKRMARGRSSGRAARINDVRGSVSRRRLLPPP